MSLQPSPQRAIDLTNCDQEPIHLPGGIQPNGCLLAFDLIDLQLTHWSANAAEWLGEPPSGGESLPEFFRPTAVEQLGVVAAGRAGIVHPLGGPVLLDNRPQAGADAAAHAWRGQLVVELQRAGVDGPGTAVPLLSLSRRLGLANQHLNASATLADLYQAIATEVRDISGYDRVMVYRFLNGGHGAVVGEALKQGLEPFLGLHYPATDIPEQARRLYTLNLVRSIADVAERPVELRSVEVSPQPLDLSFSVFRAVSPIHVEYLQNMGVAASMSISLMLGGKLWGLIACHHYSPRALSFDQRAACEMLGTLAGPCLSTRLQEESNRQRTERYETLHACLHRVAANRSFRRGLVGEAPGLMGMVGANGVAVRWSHNPESFGSTPGESLLQAIETRLAEQPGATWQTESLRTEFPDLVDDDASVAGCLAVAVEGEGLRSVIFLRDEYAREVRWGGEPVKETVQTIQGMRLSPRRSFAEWREVVRGQSLEWSPLDVELAGGFRLGIVELLSRRAAELARVNDELSRINADLNSFAYAASHDLREPLRNLNQAMYLLKEELPAATPEVESRLASMERMTSHMDELIGGILRLSRVGSDDLLYDHFSLSEVVAEAADLALGRPIRSDVHLSIDSDAELFADFHCVRELLTNLLENAAKYGREGDKTIAVGIDTQRLPAGGSEGGQPVVYVRDNGIGIAGDKLDEVFQIFRRLHLKEEYGGGTGVGLAISKKIVDRHGGSIWIESSPGQGACVFFTLSSTQPDASEGSR